MIWSEPFNVSNLNQNLERACLFCYNLHFLTLKPCFADLRNHLLKEMTTDLHPHTKHNHHHVFLLLICIATSLKTVRLMASISQSFPIIYNFCSNNWRQLAATILQNWSTCMFTLTTFRTQFISTRFVSFLQTLMISLASVITTFKAFITVSSHHMVYLLDAVCSKAILMNCIIRCEWKFTSGN